MSELNNTSSGQFCNPESVNYVHLLLSRALHQTDMSIVKQATDELKTLEEQSQFHSILQVSV